MNRDELRSERENGRRDGPPTLQQIEHQAELMSYFAASAFDALRELGDPNAAAAACQLAWELNAKAVRYEDRWRRRAAGAAWFALGAAAGVAAWAVAGGG